MHSLVWCAVMIYTLALTIHKLPILRGDERSRRTADIYIVSLAVGVLCC